MLRILLDIQVLDSCLLSYVTSYASLTNIKQACWTTEVILARLTSPTVHNVM